MDPNFYSFFSRRLELFTLVYAIVSYGEDYTLPQAHTMSSATKNYTIASFTEAYRRALHLYVTDHNGEEHRQRAYELGRKAIRMHLGVLDMVEIHYKAEKALLGLPPPEEVKEVMEKSVAFLEECLAPYEIVHRSYREMIETRRKDE